MSALIAVVSGPESSTEEAARKAVPKLREQLGRAREFAAKKAKIPKEADDD